jgi:hypothetical protein
VARQVFYHFSHVPGPRILNSDRNVRKVDWVQIKNFIFVVFFASTNLMQGVGKYFIPNQQGSSRPPLSIPLSVWRW